MSGSGAWSNGQGALTDASDGAEKSDGNGSSIDYQAPTEASKPGDVVVKLTGFNPGATQTVTFKAKVAKSATVGKDMTTNAAATPARRATAAGLPHQRSQLRSATRHERGRQRQHVQQRQRFE